MASKKNPSWQPNPEYSEENFLILLSRGNSLKIAAAASGFKLSRYQYLQDKARSGDLDAQDFMEKVEQARAHAVVEHLQVLRSAALSGDYRASIEWLKAQQRDEWNNDTKIVVEHKIYETMDALFMKIKALLPEDVYEELMDGLKMTHFLQQEEMKALPAVIESAEIVQDSGNS